MEQNTNVPYPNYYINEGIIMSTNESNKMVSEENDTKIVDYNKNDNNIILNKSEAKQQEDHNLITNEKIQICPKLNRINTNADETREENNKNNSITVEGENNDTRGNYEMDEMERRGEKDGKRESDKDESIEFEKKRTKSYKEKKEREKEMVVAYWLKGIVKILSSGLKNGDIKGSNFVGKKIAEVLKKVVEISHWNNVHDLIEIIKYLGKEIIKNNKIHFIIPNVIRRVLTIVRTEHFKQLYLYNNNYIDNLNKDNNFLIDENTNKCLNNKYVYEREIENFEKSFSFYFENNNKQNTYHIPATNTLRHSIIEGITELIADIDTSWGETEQRTSYDLFMENDVILTMGYSSGVEKFLKNINKKKDGISVIVVGGDINRDGFRMAKLLSADGVDTTYIPDSAVFAVIPRVTKVLLGSVAVSSSGGVISKIGAYNIACSAQFNAKPVIIVLPLFKLINDPFYDPTKKNELQPGPSMAYNDAENLYVRIPKYDFIPEKFIALYITEIGPLNSFQLYTMSKRTYHPDDLDLTFD
ncbi:eukaryotic translation initiation factor 2b, subunit 2 [Plasmodium gonderi]|uniref:Translation initiation factor eIF2B subunit beta n=1 Tax=Plasmodium gonderi TaxID=77519 RepID=A0A1Y1JNP2_PLAGO|nr:eukaryotic translation initiation factor 2b, subunit 2 [Plasmodium gonderi]GAW83870.1 eukaryotic translation initiation factor 2b, subunit 2 [Plasmodium gonderi]